MVSITCLSNWPAGGGDETISVARHISEDPQCSCFVGLVVKGVAPFHDGEPVDFGNPSTPVSTNEAHPGLRIIWNARHVAERESHALGELRKDLDPTW
jgi:hypothetical protein